MELVSYLAGERWSDHPACTHPLLATLARLVNDHTSDSGRGRLADLIPSVIGLTSDDPHVDVEIVLRAATTALPVAAADRQRVLAVSMLAAERTLADLDGRPVDRLEERSRWALAQAPDAAAWADRFTRGVPTTRKGFRLHAAPSTLRHAVVGIAEACIPDPDSLLRELLAGAIDDRADLIRCGDGPGSAVDPAAWTAACELTGPASVTGAGRRRVRSASGAR